MQNTQEPVLSIKDLTFSYSTEPLIDIQSFDLQQKEQVAVIGPSGSGKSTLMHLIAGLIRPTRGNIQLSGQEITQLKEWQIDRLRGKEVGIVFQKFHLLPSITVFENLLMAQRMARVNIDKSRAKNLLQRLGISELANHMPRELSQGQVQRAAIARAVVHRPSLVIGDEPTSALDDKNSQEAIGLLQELSNHEEFSLLIVTHDQRVRSAMDKIIELGVDS